MSIQEQVEELAKLWISHPVLSDELIIEKVVKFLIIAEVESNIPIYFFNNYAEFQLFAAKEFASSSIQDMMEDLEIVRKILSDTQARNLSITRFNTTNTQINSSVESATSTIRQIVQKLYSQLVVMGDYNFCSPDANLMNIVLYNTKHKNATNLNATSNKSVYEQKRQHDKIRRINCTKLYQDILFYTLGTKFTKNAIFVIRKPPIIRVDDDYRLHCDHDVALDFGINLSFSNFEQDRYFGELLFHDDTQKLDETSVKNSLGIISYYIDGVEVSEKTVKNPKELTLQDVARESSIDARNIMIHRNDLQSMINSAAIGGTVETKIEDINMANGTLESLLILNIKVPYTKPNLYTLFRDREVKVQILIAVDPAKNGKVDYIFLTNRLTFKNCAEVQRYLYAPDLSLDFLPRADRRKLPNYPNLRT